MGQAERTPSPILLLTAGLQLLRFTCPILLKLFYEERKNHVESC